MSIRTVRLDKESERALQRILESTGMSVSAALKKGLLVLRDEVIQQSERRPYDIYRELDLGPGGYAIGPSTETRKRVKTALKAKLKR